MAAMAALPLQELIASLDNSCLPRILQVCSGVYFQGSIYEISGSEVCFSTGDLIKVTGIELLSVCCEDVFSHDKFELPISHTGLFQLVPDDKPFISVEEMLSLRPVGLDSCLPFTFTCLSRTTFGNLTLGAGKVLTVVSVQRGEGGTGWVRCTVRGQEEASAEVCIPLSARGEFQECESGERFTLQEIMASPGLRCRKFHFINTTKSSQMLVLSPVYQVHALMNLRKNMLKFPSSLEVDVVDVTNMCGDVNFVTPLSLSEVLSLPDDRFPAVVEVLEHPEDFSLFKCSWLPQLSKAERLVFHRKGISPMVLASSLKGRRSQQYFLVSQQYAGRFRRRPREFSSAYEMYAALVQAPGLRVSVTRNCEEDKEEGLPGLSIGDQLELLHCKKICLPGEGGDGQKPSVEALCCRRLQEVDEDDEEDEELKQEDQGGEVFLPLYMQGHFVEVVTDNKKYRLGDLGKKFKLPLDVKVVSRDAELEQDLLVMLPCLRIEEAMLEPTIIASFPDQPDHSFEIPSRWLHLSISFTEDPPPGGQTPACRVETVTEVTDSFLYELRKQSAPDAAPPPRPPKQYPSTIKSSKKMKKNKSKHQPHRSVPTKELNNMSLNSKRRPPAPPPPDTAQDEAPPVTPRKHPGAKQMSSKAQPNTYVKMQDTKALLLNVESNEDSDHDYEIVEDVLSVVKNTEENIIFY